MVSITDGDARLNALAAGQVQGMESLTFAQAKQEQTAGRIKVLVGNGPINTPMVMSVTAKPFDDVRVRQAMRLLVDREQMIKNVQLGFGQIGNDLYGKQLAFYDRAIPQRPHDPEKARSLLKAAGADSVKLSLTTSTVGQGMLESATAFAQQAKLAGVTIALDQKPGNSYWTDGYLKTSFFQTVWLSSPIDTWYQLALFRGGVWNETGWSDPAFEKRVEAAQGVTVAARAADHWNSIQQEMWNRGGYIFWGFYPWLDGVSKKVSGAHGSGFLPLGSHAFRVWSLNA
jgi:peptide/nickel transport system substrate-binding protein